MLLETMLLALLGGVLGAAIAWLLFDHYTASTLGSNFTQIVFAFRVSPELLWRGLKWALAMGLLGGLFPALRAAHVGDGRLTRTVKLCRLTESYPVAAYIE